MWVFTTLGFFSIVAHRDRPDCVLVRARVKADLSALVKLLPLPRPKVQRTPDADYLFRVVVGKEAMARVLAQLTEAIDYDNFKDAVAHLQGVPRAKVYHDVWHALLPLQQPKLAIVKPKPKRKYGPNGGIVFGEVSAEEVGAIERARERYRERVAIDGPDFNPAAAVRAEIQRSLAAAAADKAIAAQPVETDAGMMLDPDEIRPEDEVDYVETEAERERARAYIAAMPPALVDLFTSEYCVPTAVEEHIETDAGMMPKKKSRSTKEDPDAGMMPDPDEPPEFKRSDDATEAEATAALRARMGEAQFNRFLDQADGRDIRCFDKDGKEI